MTKVYEPNIDSSNNSAYLALSLIVQNILAKKLRDSNIEVSLSMRVKDELRLTEEELEYLGKYLSEVYQRNLKVTKISDDTTLRELLDMYYERMESYAK